MKTTRTISPEQRDKIREKLDAFNEASLEILDFKPKIIRRVDSYNIVYYNERISKISGEKYLSDPSYYGSLKFALRKLLAELLGVNKLKDENIFDEFKGIKPENCTRELHERVITAFRLELKKQKKILKGDSQ